MRPRYTSDSVYRSWRQHFCIRIKCFIASLLELNYIAPGTGKETLNEWGQTSSNLLSHAAVVETECDVSINNLTFLSLTTFTQVMECWASCDLEYYAQFDWLRSLEWRFCEQALEYLSLCTLCTRSPLPKRNLGFEKMSGKIIVTPLTLLHLFTASDSVPALVAGTDLQEEFRIPPGGPQLLPDCVF